MGDLRRLIVLVVAASLGPGQEESRATAPPRRNDHKRAATAAYQHFRAAVAENRYLDALTAIETAEGERRAGGLEQFKPAFRTGLFDVLYEVGDIASARRVLAEVASLTDPSNPAEMRYLRARQALVHHADGARALERQANEETLALDGQAPTSVPELRWTTILNLIDLAAERGDLAEARRYLAQAAAIRRGRGRVALLFRRAQVERAAGHDAEARRLLGAAEALHPGEEIAWQLATDQGELLERAGDLAGAARRYESAIDLLDHLGAALVGSDLQLWSLARKRRPYARLLALHARQGRAARAFAVWDRFQRRAFVQSFLARPPGILGSAAGVPPPPISGLFYFEGVDELFVFIVRAGDVSVRRVGDSASIDPLLARFVARPGDPGVATRLGDLLVPELPVASPDEVLFISTARPLAEVPFAALRPRGRLLVEQAALSLLPSLAVLEAASSIGRGPAVVLADPRGDLPAARVEGQEAAAALGVEALVGARAAQSALVQARDARVVHFATHSGLGPSGPWLELAATRLLAPDVLALGLHPRLVVLPTCASAVGAAPGISPSLAALFLMSGAGHVVGALRSVEDASSRRLMSDFYAAGGADDAVGALAAVQRRWSRQRPVEEWSPFVVLTGSQPPGTHRGDAR
jgi:tetratricopeptide (TPR) repeat protein